MELSGQDPVFVLPGADPVRAARAIQFGRHLNGGFTCIVPRRVYAHSSLASGLAQALGADPNFPVITVGNVEEAIGLANASPYALGATIFGNEADARRLASRIRAGVVVINDMIVPTADPRVSFGGFGSSGFGRTRGAEGLLEMTGSKYVVVQRARRLRHLEPVPSYAEELFLQFLAAQHGAGLKTRMAGWRNLLRVVSRGTRRAANESKEVH